jgi:hypothetical protein
MSSAVLTALICSCRRWLYGELKRLSLTDEIYLFHVTSQGEGLIKKLHELRRQVSAFLARDGLN